MYLLSNTVYNWLLDDQGLDPISGIVLPTNIQETLPQNLGHIIGRDDDAYFRELYPAPFIVLYAYLLKSKRKSLVNHKKGVGFTF